MKTLFILFLISLIDVCYAIGVASNDPACIEAPCAAPEMPPQAIAAILAIGLAAIRKFRA